MKVGTLAASVTAGAMMVLAAAAAAKSAEVKVMAGSALAGVIGELGPGFERATGHNLVVQYGLSRSFRQQIDAGEAFDLAILSVDIMDDLFKRDRFSSRPFVGIARAGLGVAVRTGASKPDISSVDAFKRVLLNAKSISYAPKTEGGEHLDRVFEHLGIVEQLKPILMPQQAIGQVVPVVAGGRAELAMAVTSILSGPGVELVGKIPDLLQLYLVFTSGVSGAAKQPEAAMALVTHLTSPAAAPMFISKGWEPATR